MGNLMLIVGEQPSARGNGSPFSGPSGERLTDLIGRDWRIVMSAVNLMPSGVWKREEMRAVGKRMREKLARDQHFKVVLLAGRTVADAFGFAQTEPFFKRLVRRSVHYYIIPHPSGKNRWWNDSKNRRKFSAWFEGLTEVYPG
jgi:uracil-DNA glycosylase